jgi:hypothetical protein
MAVGAGSGEMGEGSRTPAAGEGNTVGGSVAQAPPLGSTPEERAARFLDLWERNLTYMALHGPARAPTQSR